MALHLKKTLIHSAVTGALLIGTAGFSTAQAELEFNVGVFSDYLLWGGSASDNNAVVQGGIDWGHDSGFYVGTWASTLADGAGQELDLYAGYTFEAGGLDFDLGYVYYYYPKLGDLDIDYGDLYASVGFGPVYAKFQYALNADFSDYEGSTVYKLGADHEIMPSISLNGELGYTKQKAVGEFGDDVSWTFWSLGLTKSTDMGDISFTYAQSDEELWNDDPLFVVGYSISF
jgi:uncharacterized protein (TIGR02001 family)